MEEEASVWAGLLESVQSAAAAFLSFNIVFGGTVPYIIQGRQMLQRKDTRGFSLWVCQVLIVSMVLRIGFWMARGFETELLLQAIVIIVAMLAMIRLVKNLNRSLLPVHPKRPYLSIFSSGGIRRHWWAWEDWQSFALVTGAWAIGSVWLGRLLWLWDWRWAADSLGLAALLAEANLGTPQLLSNHRRRSTKGMSVVMVLMWLGGDVFKTVYFVLRHTPAQFWLCGSLQICIDLVIIGQVIAYRRPTVAVHSGSGLSDSTSSTLSSSSSTHDL